MLPDQDIVDLLQNPPEPMTFSEGSLLAGSADWAGVPASLPNAVEAEENQPPPPPSSPSDPSPPLPSHSGAVPRKKRVRKRGTGVDVEEVLSRARLTKEDLRAADDKQIDDMKADQALREDLKAVRRKLLNRKYARTHKEKRDGILAELGEAARAGLEKFDAASSDADKNARAREFVKDMRNAVEAYKAYKAAPANPRKRKHE